MKAKAQGGSKCQLASVKGYDMSDRALLDDR
jgi:hypothetical protein